MWGGGGGGVIEEGYVHLCTVPLSLDSEPSLPHLMDRVAAVIPHKFETVGLQLGLTLGELQVIGPHHPSLSEQLTSWIIEGSGDP